MKKLKNDGFIMVETLLVAAFVLGIFTFIYVNVIPLIGIYEQRNTYDDVESVYNIDTIRDNLNLTGLTVNTIYTKENFCNTLAGTVDLCKKMLSSMEINYIGEINTNVIGNINGETNIGGLKEYLNYIEAPAGTIIVIVKQHTDQYSGDDNLISGDNNDFDALRTYPVRFANLEVNL